MGTTATGHGDGTKASRAAGTPVGEKSGMGMRVAAWVAGSACAVSLALTALGLLLVVLSREHPGVPVFWHWLEDAVIAVGFSLVGAVVAHRFPPRNPIGWLFCAIGLVSGAILFATEFAYYSALVHAGTLPGDRAMAWGAFWLWVPQAGLFAFLGLLFPDGRLPSPRWRPFAWLVGAAVTLGTLAEAFAPASLGMIGTARRPGPTTIPNPLGVEGVPNLYGPVEALTYSLTLASALSLLWRLRGADGVERQQIKWFAYAAAVAALGSFFLYIVSGAVGAPWLFRELDLVVTVAGLAGLPVALGVAIMKYRLHDIDLIVNKTLVYGILVAVLAGLFEITLVTMQHVMLAFAHAEESNLAYFGTALVMAALFEPLKRRIDAFVEGRFFREEGGAGS
jgi:hypothetical protein